MSDNISDYKSTFPDVVKQVLLKRHPLEIFPRNAHYLSLKVVNDAATFVSNLACCITGPNYKL